MMSFYSNSCCQTSVKLLATFAFQRITRARATSCCDPRLRTSRQTWPPNRPNLSSVDYKLLRVIQECFYQKQQGTSNIVDELWLLTEWHFISRMAYYISQGRVETLIRRGWQLCCSSVVNLFHYVCAKNYRNIMRFHKVIAKIKGCNFFVPQCTIAFALKSKIQHVLHVA